LNNSASPFFAYNDQGHFGKAICAEAKLNVQVIVMVEIPA